MRSSIFGTQNKYQTFSADGIPDMMKLSHNSKKEVIDMKKKALSLLLSLVLILTMLTGCGGNTTRSVPSAPSQDSVPAEQTPAQAPIQEASTESVSEPASLQEDSAEPEEAQVTITYPLCPETQTLSLYCTAANFMGPLSSVSMTWEDFDCFQAVEALTNVHIDFEAVSFESYMTQFNIYVAAGDYADLITSVDSKYVGGAQSAFEDGVIVDIEPYLREYAPDYYTMLQNDPVLAESAYTPEDQLFEFIATYDTPGVKNGTLARGDWLDQLDLEIKTVEDMHTYLSAAKNRFGADVPLYMTTRANDFATAFNVSSYTVGGGNLSFYVVDGEIRSPLNQPDYRDYLSTMRDWYAEGLIYQDFATQSFDPHDNTFNQMIYNGQVAVWATMLEGLDDYEANAADPDFISRPLPEITVDGSVNHCSTVEYVIGDSDITVSTNCENVPLAVSWMNYWYTEEGIRMYNYGPEGDAYHLEGDKVVLEDFVLNNEYGVDVSSFLRMYCPYGSFVGVYLRSRLTDYSSQLQLDAAEIWTASNDAAYVVSDGVSVDAAENETLTKLAADITTYADPCIPKFIMGDMDIDTEWDSYIETLNSMGIEECIAIEQIAYDAYIG